MQIRIRRDDCCGNGQCLDIAPAVFTLDAKHKCTVLDPEADTQARVIEAAEACPCQAIEVLDDEGNTIFP
jgi:ferredoxin